MTDLKRRCELSWQAATEGLRLPADSSLQACALESTVALGCLSCVSASKSEVDHLHTRGTAPLLLGWRSLQLRVWEPGAWRWPAAVYSLHFAVRCPSRWAPRSRFLRSWLEVGSPSLHLASWLKPLLTEGRKHTLRFNAPQLELWEMPPFKVTSGSLCHLWKPTAIRKPARSYVFRQNRQKWELLCVGGDGELDHLDFIYTFTWTKHIN